MREIMNISFKKSLVALATIASLSVTLSPVVNAADVPSGVQLAKEQVLKEGTRDYPVTMDPAKAIDVASNSVLLDVFNQLINYDDKGNVIPGDAKSWDVSPDGKTVTFHLRPGLKWSDGSPLTAHDYEFSFKRWVDPKTGSDYSYYLSLGNVVNSKEVLDVKVSPDKLGVKALDDNTLQIKLDKSTPYFVSTLGIGFASPISEKNYKKWGDDYFKPEHMVSNGAFKIDQWVVNEKVVSVRNTNYWNNKKTVLDKVIYRGVPDYATQVNFFKSGDLDTTYTVPIEQFSTIKKEMPNQLHSSDILKVFYYDFNTQKAPFDNVKVRKALSYTINREALANSVIGMGSKPLYSLLPPSTAGQNKFTPTWSKEEPKALAQKAIKLLNEAGFNKEHPLEFTVLLPNKPEFKKAAQAIQSMWQSTLPVKVKLNVVEYKTWLAQRSAPSTQVAADDWFADYNDPTTFYGLFTSTSTQNSPHFHNKEYDSLLAKAATASSDAERRKYFTEVDKVIDKNMFIAPQYSTGLPYLVKPYVKGWVNQNPLAYFYAKNVYIEKH